MSGRVTQLLDEIVYHGQFVRGNEVFEFEEKLAEYLGCKHVISCANGTDALQVALMALTERDSSGSKNEVIIPAFAYAAVAEVVLLLKLKVVFCDVDIDTFNIDAEQIESKITNKTLAIIPVHLFGQCADMSKIMKLSIKYNIPVIEDTAQALGAKHHGMMAGTIGAIGTTSFFPTKNLACCGDGGAIFCEDDELARLIRMICNHGQEERYHHDIIGINSRLDTIQAIVLMEKLKTLNGDIKAKRNDERTEGIYVLPGNYHTYHQYTIKKRIAGKRIYYPLPLHWQPAFRQDVSMPVAELLSQSVCSL